MEGNEFEKCVKCKQICDGDFYKCDSCFGKIHRECVNITSSEVRCMRLQKRVLLLICEECKQLIARMPYMVKLMEEMKKDIELLKSNHRRDTYANVLQNQSNDKGNILKSSHTIIIKPKEHQSVEKSRKEVQTSINPAKINVGIREIKETKKGSIILKCDTEPEMRRLKEEAENQLKGNYEIELSKKILPKIKIAGYTGHKPAESLEKIIRKQNAWIEPKEHLKITFIRCRRNKSNSTIYVECSGSLYAKMLNYGRIYVEWDRLPVYEDFNVARCYNCQGFHHKSNKCTREQVCGNCAGDHNTIGCEDLNKMCINCVTANKKYKTQYGTDHSALDSNCPSLKYHMGLIKNKTDYNS